uniref:Replication-associated protein n=1 Tax=Giant panda circovirus 5 TaxID=2863957 RepID=A0A8K1HIQ5_9CIRC|nr:replication-associated protein [Giant panda circovirus 5]
MTVTKMTDHDLPTRNRHVCCVMWKINDKGEEIWPEPMEYDDNIMSYYVYGDEICPETLRPHWQVYIEFKKQMGIKALKKLLKQSTNIRSRRGTAEQASRYCKKDGKWMEFGTLSVGQGKRTDLDDICRKLVDGTMTIDEVKEQAPTKYIRNYKGMENLAMYAMKKQQKDWVDMDLQIWWGPTRTGKTREWYKNHIKDGYHVRNYEYWGTYRGQKHILMDEFRMNTTLSEILQLTDGYPIEINAKQGHNYKLWETIVMTMNTDPAYLYQGCAEEDREAFAARVKKVVYFTKEGRTETDGLVMKRTEVVDTVGADNRMRFAQRVR